MHATEMGSVAAELNERRVAHALVAHLGVSWIVVEASGFMEQRYGLDRALTDSVLIIVLAILPSVLLFAWNHGRPGHDDWRKSELGFFAVNAVLILAALGVRTTVASDKATQPETPAVVVDAAPEQAEVAEVSVGVVASVALDWTGSGREVRS